MGGSPCSWLSRRRVPTRSTRSRSRTPAPFLPPAPPRPVRPAGRAARQVGEVRQQVAFVRTAEQPELVPQQGSLAAQEPAEGPPDPTADHLPEARAGSAGVHRPAPMGGQVLALARLPKTRTNTGVPPGGGGDRNNRRRRSPDGQRTRGNLDKAARNQRLSIYLDCRHRRVQQRRRVPTSDPRARDGNRRIQRLRPHSDPAQFQKYVSEGKIHYFVVSDSTGGFGGGGGPSSNGTASSITMWVEAHYKATTVDGMTIYDLAGNTK